MGHTIPVASGASSRRAGFAALLAAEALKLRRSAAWVVVVLLPVLALVSGSVNYLMNQEVLSRGMASMISQVLVFYSLFFCSMAVGLLAATVWRPEHRSAGWNAMRTTAHGPVAVVLAKTLVITVPVAAMQVGLVVATWTVAACMGLGTLLPAGFVVTCLLSVLTAQPLVALQSLLSMRMRSFAAPVAVCLAGVVVGVGAVMRGSGASVLWPQSLLTRTLALGSTAVSDSGGLDAASLTPILGGAAVSGFVCWELLALVAHRTGGPS